MSASRFYFHTYVWTLIILGFALLVYVSKDIARIELAIALVLAVGIGALETVRFSLPRGEAISASSGLVLMILWVYGLGVAALANSIAVLVAGVARRGFASNVLFNVALLTVSIVVAGSVYDVLGGSSDASVFVHMINLLISGVAFFLVNSALVEGALSYYKRTAFMPLWLRSLRHFGVRFGLPLTISIALVAGYPYLGSMFLFVIIALVVGQYFLLRRYAQASQEQAVTSLLELTAQRDAYRPGHSDRVLRYSSAIGEEIGLDKSEMRLLRYAALLHDVGVAVLPEEVLGKESALGVEERREIERHPAEGARLLAQIGPLVPVARLVRHHHEWYNGSGYPDGLQGEDIPLGSRILAAADAFDAMTTDQPHRRGLTPQSALEEMNRMTGVQFDSEVVEALSSVLQKDVTLASNVIGQDIDDEISLTIRHLKEYVTGSYAGRGLRIALGGQGDQDEDILQEVRRRAAGILALYDLGRVINSSLSLKQVLDLVARTAGRTVNARCAVLLLDPETNQLRFAATYGLTTADRQLPALHADEGPWGEALESGRPVMVAKASSKRWPRALRSLLSAEGLTSCFFLPMIAKDRSIGLICLCHSIVKRFSEQEENLLAIIASQAALAIENAKLYSETKTRLEEISTMKQFTDAILENVNTGIVVVDERGQLQLINRVAKIIAKGSDPDLSDQWQNSRVFRALKKSLPISDVLQTGVLGHADAIEVECDSGEMILEAQASAYTDRGGRSTGVIITFRDITEKLKLEAQVRQAQQLAMVGGIAAGAAHEIRNPLTSIKGFMQVMQDRSDLQQMEKKYMGIIMSEIERIDELLTELMLLARPQALKTRPCDLNELIDEQCMLVGKECDELGVKIGKSYQDLPLIECDPNQIKQVVLNLVTNALQAMPKGGILSITTEYHCELKEIEFRVKDTGIGISEQDIERIFTPFFTTKERGTGLGLAVSYGIVRNHRGKIDVVSQPGEYSEFRVSIPVR